MNIIESASAGLGKRYGRSWALRDCTLGIPGGHVVGLASLKAGGAGEPVPFRPDLDLFREAAPGYCGAMGGYGARASCC
jgi:hypothetical protein